MSIVLETLGSLIESSDDENQQTEGGAVTKRTKDIVPLTRMQVISERTYPLSNLL